MSLGYYLKGSSFTTWKSSSLPRATQWHGNQNSPGLVHLSSPPPDRPRVVARESKNKKERNCYQPTNRQIIYLSPPNNLKENQLLSCNPQTAQMSLPPLPWPALEPWIIIRAGIPQFTYSCLTWHAATCTWGFFYAAVTESNKVSCAISYRLGMSVSVKRFGTSVSVNFSQEVIRFGMSVLVNLSQDKRFS